MSEVPLLDEQRRTQHDTVNRESARQSDLGARLEALRALQEKVQTEGKLKPWLAKHGLDSLQALWTRLHIEAGWEVALEAALRERLNALSVGRLDIVRAFAADAPPAELAFYSLPQAVRQHPPDAAAAVELLRLTDASMKALLNDWLEEGVYTAASLDEALAQRAQLTHGEVIAAARATRCRSSPWPSTPPIPSRPACWPARRRSRTLSSARARPRR
ncbi:MAG: hypothetical protein U1F53_19235 [Burkholderiaceae bacterium]